MPCSLLQYCSKASCSFASYSFSSIFVGDCSSLGGCH
jgi:hypothetical protein